MKLFSSAFQSCIKRSGHDHDKNLYLAVIVQSLNPRNLILQILHAVFDYLLLPNQKSHRAGTALKLKSFISN